MKLRTLGLLSCAVLLIAACGSTHPNRSGSASQPSTLVAETAVPVSVFPTPLPVSTSTSEPSPTLSPADTAQPLAPTAVRVPIRGTWQHVLTPEEPCTHTLWHLDGYEVIGADKGIICRPTSKGWVVDVVPAQHRVIDLGSMLIAPPGGLYAQTDTGQMCRRAAYSAAGTSIPPQDQQWKCEDNVRWPTQVPKENLMGVGNGTYRFKDGIYIFIGNATRDGGDMRYFAAETLTGVADSQITWAAPSNYEPLQNGLWVGTDAHGLFFINQATASIQHWNQANGLSGAAIRHIQSPYLYGKDWQNVIWVATDNGIARFDGAMWKTYQVQDGLPSNDVRALFVDHIDGIPWAATAKGAAYFDGQSWTTLPTDGLVIEDLIGVAGSYEEPDTKIIFGSRDNGLFVFTLLKP